jgi:hypothetical protein
MSKTVPRGRAISAKMSVSAACNTDPDAEIDRGMEGLRSPTKWK